MRILFLSTTFPRFPGDSVGVFIHALARGLAGRHEVTVLTPHAPGARPRDVLDGVSIRRFRYFVPAAMERVIYPQGIMDRLKTSRLARLQVPLFLLAYFLSAVRLSRRCDVLLCNWAITGAVARAACALTGKPYVVILRGTDVQILASRGMAARLFRFGLRRAAAVCVVAPHLKATMAAQGFPDVHITPNGMDYDVFSIHREDARRRLGQTGDLMVLHVGRLMEEKGVRTLVQAMRGLPAELVLIGEGLLRHELQELAEREGVRARFLGALPWNDLPPWFAAADVFVLPSLSEGRPNALMEALASGTACVASRIPAVEELIRDGENGLLAVPGDADSLRQAIERLLRDAPLRERLARAGRDRLRQQVPTWQECADRYSDLLEQMERA